MTSDRGIKAEHPIVHTPAWRQVYELDLEIRKVAFLIGYLRHQVEIPSRVSGQPFVQRFQTRDESGEFEGTYLGRLENGDKEMATVLAFHPRHHELNLTFWQKVERGQIRDIPVVGITEAAQASREIERYDLSSLYRAWVDYKISPGSVFNLINDLTASVSQTLVDEEGFIPSEFADQCWWYLKGADLSHYNWD